MARLLRLTPEYLSSARRLGVLPGTDASRDVRRVLRALERSDELDLPGPDDLMILRPPRAPTAPHSVIYGRRVPSRSLWIWYRATRAHLELVELSSTATPSA